MMMEGTVLTCSQAYVNDLSTTCVCVLEVSKQLVYALVLWHSSS